MRCECWDICVESCRMARSEHARGINSGKGRSLKKAEVVRACEEEGSRARAKKNASCTGAGVTV